MPIIIAQIGKRTFTWTFDDTGSVYLDGQRIDISVRKVTQHTISVLMNGNSFNASVHGNGDGYDILIDSKYIQVSVESSSRKRLDRLSEESGGHSSRLEVRAPMPGMVVRCEVKDGDAIHPGDGLVVLEAMKMENEIKSTIGGTVKKVFVSDKQVVEKGELLLVIE